MNKMFTATAVLQLVQAGKVKLDAPLGTYLTDYPNRDVATKVTIHHLLTHTGGTGDIFGPEFSRAPPGTEDARRLREALRRARPRVRARVEVGVQQLRLPAAGRDCRDACPGQSYYDYVRDHIFKPAGMTRQRVGAGGRRRYPAAPRATCSRRAPGC